ncbi:MAG: hypothetical protein NTV21_12230 [Planctomycetota bacterium]|nr:hypothetical protein [Planctomycetota bacterium]
MLALIFGALGPALCFGLALSLELDPFGRFSVALHTAAVSGILLLFVQVSGRTRAPRASALLSGGLASSALHALLAGVLLLPFSIVLLISVIGLLGFIPFGTAWVLCRAAREAWSNAAKLPPRPRLALGACGAALAALFPLGQPVAQEVAYAVAFERVDLATSDALEHANAALDWVPCLSVEPLKDEAGSEEDEARFQRLSKLCQLRFGFPIEQEIWAD